MKHLLQCILVVVFLLIHSLPAYAQGPGRAKTGLSGRIQGGAFFIQTDSQLSTVDDNSQNDDLDGPADTQEKILPLVSLLLRYRFEGGTSVYFGNPLEVGEGLAVSAGVNQPLNAGALDVAVTWLPIEEVWENPYETVTTRNESDVDNFGLRIKWQQIGGSPWDAEYKVHRIEVENDEIGKIENDLKRDGWTHELGIKYAVPLGKGLNLKPELTYINGDFEGPSNSYQGVKLGALLQRIRPPWVLIGYLSGEYNEYEKRHPIFDKTREALDITAFGQVMRLNLFGVKKLFGSLAAGYVWSEANIDFFDSGTIIGLASVGMEF